ncbi:MAG: hypothetical protein QXG11_07835 [Candidatus Bathyarchaeia archaeon]
MKCKSWASELKRVFPKCPICGSNMGYDVTIKLVTPYFRIKGMEEKYAILSEMW